MLIQTLYDIKDFREKIYSSITYRADACMELLDALCSNITADTPVKLSLNQHFRRGYSSITDAISEFHNGGYKQSDNLRHALMRQITKNNNNREYYLFVTDCTSAPRPYSVTLPDRSVIYSSNPISGNKPINIGHKYSITGFLPPKAANSPPWLLPLATQRVCTNADESLLGAEQMQQVLDFAKKTAPDKICVNVVDSGYCKPEYINKLHSKHANNNNLVTIVRARSNRVLWKKSVETHSKYSSNRGHELWYGSKFDFKDEETWHVKDRSFTFKVFTKKGKECLVEILAWDNMLMRQKRGIPMNDHPLTLVRVTMTDTDGNQIFHKPLWLMLFGTRRCELNLEHVYKSYMQRYDVEHFFKFEKNNLLADKLQTSDTKHEESWWSICSLAYSILFISRFAAHNMPYPWEKYLPAMQQAYRLPSPTQVQRSFQQITDAIGTPARSPKQRGNPLGRAIGSRQIKRERHSVIIKAKKICQKVAA